LNLFNFLSRGTAPIERAHIAKAANESREKWIHALQADEMRAWLDLGQAQQKTLTGLSVLLTLAGFVHVHDKRGVDTPELRVIRGAISTIEMCTKRGHVIREVDAIALQTAATRAKEIIRAASVDAICHAATTMDKMKEAL
jgi:hypothetical protein